MGVDEGKCQFCQSMEDNSLLQLFVCKEVQDSTFDDLLEVITNPLSYVTEVLLPKNHIIQQRFIERIRFLINQHEFINELLKERFSS